MLRWYEHWLKGIDNGVDREPPVRIYVMGGGDAHKTPEGRLFVGGRWRDEREWPLARTNYTPFFLHTGGELSPQVELRVRPSSKGVAGKNRRVGPKNFSSKFEGRQIFTFAASSRFSNSMGESSMMLAGVQLPLSSAAA